MGHSTSIGDTMDKGKIEKFSVNARVKLRDMVLRKLVYYGVDPQHPPKEIHDLSDRFIIVLDSGLEISISSDEKKARDQLIEEISKQGVDNIVESVSYTWFNRLIAIRYMEVNDYLPTHVRVLSSVDPSKKEPDLVSQCLRVDLNNSSDKERLFDLKEKGRFDDLFTLLFLTQCRELNKILPELFTNTKPFENILLSLSYTDQNGVVRNLVDQISEEDFKDAVQIIGWMYQFYNKELKDDTEKQLKKGVKVGKDRLPAKTQLFTPDWIVRYMVENSIGRIWLEGHDDKILHDSWKYYVDEAPQSLEVQSNLNEIRSFRSSLKPEEIRVIDPCMGSGHILVYAFDVLMQIYVSYGYTKSDAAASIVRNNLYGLDIDDRAYQLAYFAVMMKARQYDPTFFDKNVPNNIHTIPDSSDLTEEVLENYGVNLTNLESITARADIKYILSVFRKAKTYGSLIKLNNDLNWDIIERFLKGRTATFYFSPALHIKLIELIEVAKILSTRFEIVITNPPYLGSSSFDELLDSYVKDCYCSNHDLYTCFIERCSIFSKPGCYTSMITQDGWMFLKNFIPIREYLSKKTIENVLHLGPHAFDQISGEKVRSVVFTLCNNSNRSFRGVYHRILDGKSESEKESLFLSNDVSYFKSLEDMSDAPDQAYPYWLSSKMIEYFSGKLLSDYAATRQGLATGDNDRFLRYWFEVDSKSIGQKWFPCNKGGSSRKWYGSNLHVVDWENDGYNLKNFVDDKGKRCSVLRNIDYYFREGLTWSTLGNNFAMRYCPSGFIFESKGAMCFIDNPDNMSYLLGLLNSSVAKSYLEFLAPTLDFHEGPVSKIPTIISIPDKNDVNLLVKECISISKIEWDSDELSWDFETNPIVSRKNYGKIELAVNDYLDQCTADYNQMVLNETRLDDIFLRVYGFEDASNSAVSSSISIPSVHDVIVDLLSYIIGCCFGRYSLDNKGIICSNDQLDPSQYSSFEPCKNDIIPLVDGDYFSDDLINYVERFCSIVFGENNLEENLKFISNSLELKASGTSRDRIRQYYSKQFFLDHKKKYQKCPIYWLFDSGSSFRAFVYMNRYSPGLLDSMRQKYVLHLQGRYEDQYEREKDPVIKGKLASRIEEIKDYDLALDYYSSNPITIDLDNGVKANYSKFQNLAIKGKNKTISLLRDIEV